MTLDEAIEQNKQWLKEHPHLGAVNEFKALPPYEAIKLGLEALKREQNLRREPPYARFRLLLGETKEVKQCKGS